MNFDLCSTFWPMRAFVIRARSDICCDVQTQVISLCPRLVCRTQILDFYSILPILTQFNPPFCLFFSQTKSYWSGTSPRFNPRTDPGYSTGKSKHETFTSTWSNRQKPSCRRFAHRHCTFIHHLPTDWLINCHNNHFLPLSPSLWWQCGTIWGHFMYSYSYVG